MNFVVIHIIIITNFVSEITNLTKSPTYVYSNIISAWKYLSIISLSGNNKIEKEIKFQMENYERQYVTDQISMNPNIHENIKWGVRGIAMFLFPLIVGILPLVENKLLNRLCTKRKKVFNIGFLIENNT